MDINKAPKVAMTNEIVNAMVYSDVDAAAAQRAVNGEIDLHDAIYTQMNINISRDISFDFVANDDNTVNLILPYYESIEAERAKMIGDEELGEVAGGELFIVAIIGGIYLGSIIGAAAGWAATGGVAGAAITVGTVVGGVIGGVVAGTAVATLYAGVGVLIASGVEAGQKHLAANPSAPGYSELASAQKTGNSLLGI